MKAEFDTYAVHGIITQIQQIKPKNFVSTYAITANSMEKIQEYKDFNEDQMQTSQPNTSKKTFMFLGKKSKLLVSRVCIYAYFCALVFDRLNRFAHVNLTLMSAKSCRRRQHLPSLSKKIDS